MHPSRRLPPLTALRAFEAVARHLSMARAAEELHVTPAAVSQQIRLLEESLGVPLFHRGKRLALSDHAAAAAPQLSEAFDRLERAVARLRAGTQEGPLVVSTTPAFAARWLVPRLDDFQSCHPGIELRLLATRRVVDFDREEVDVAIRFGRDPGPGLHVERLMAEEILPVAAPGVAAGIHSADDIARCTLLQNEGQVNQSAFPDWETWLASLGASNTGPLRYQRFGDANLTTQAAVAGMGAALMWRSLVADDLRAGRLVVLLDHAIASDQSYFLVMPADRPLSPRLAAFCDWLREQTSTEQVALPA